MFKATTELVVSIVVQLAGPIILNPFVAAPGAIVLCLGLLIARVYLKAQLSIKREQRCGQHSCFRKLAPILLHFSLALQRHLSSLILAQLSAALVRFLNLQDIAECSLQIVSIRAYGAQTPVTSESLRRINHYSRLSKNSYDLNRWMSVRTDILGASFAVAVASYLLVKKNQSAGVIGFSLTASMGICDSLLYVVRCWNEFEVQANRWVPVAYFRPVIVLIIFIQPGED